VANRYIVTLFYCIMRKIKFEDLLKLSEEEQDKICALSHSLNEDERVEIENPIKYMNDEETIEYFHKLGALTWEEVSKRINDMFDKASESI